MLEANITVVFNSQYRSTILISNYFQEVWHCLVINTQKTQNTMTNV